MIHFTFEGSFLYLSTFGRQVNTSVGPFAEMCESTSRISLGLYMTVCSLKKGENMLMQMLAGASLIQLSSPSRY